MAILIQEGKLSLDDDVRKYLPEMPDYGQPIKISNLLYQTSGVRDEYALAAMAGVRAGDRLTVSDMLNLIYRQREQNFTPGSEYVYSNYTLLAQIIERLTGQPLAKFATERIFGPLGLAHTHQLSMDRGVLTLDSRTWPHTALLPESGSHFVAALGLPAMPVDFIYDAAGRVNGFTFSLPRVRGVRFEKR